MSCLGSWDLPPMELDLRLILELAIRDPALCFCNQQLYTVHNINNDIKIFFLPEQELTAASGVDFFESNSGSWPLLSEGHEVHMFETGYANPVERSFVELTRHLPAEKPQETLWTYIKMTSLNVWDQRWGDINGWQQKATLHGGVSGDSYVEKLLENTSHVATHRPGNSVILALCVSVSVSVLLSLSPSLPSSFLFKDSICLSCLIVCNVRVSNLPKETDYVRNLVLAETGQVPCSKMPGGLVDSVHLRQDSLVEDRRGRTRILRSSICRSHTNSSKGGYFANRDDRWGDWTAWYDLDHGYVSRAWFHDAWSK